MNDVKISTSETAPRTRRFRTISLRLLFVLIAGLAVWLGWITNRARRQAEVLAELRRQKCEVYFDHEYRPGKVGIAWSRAGPPRGPAWLRRRLGEEYFRKIASVTWRGVDDPSAISPSAHDAFFAKLTSFGGLRQLEIHSRAVSSRAFVNASGLSGLEDLELRGCPNVSDDIFLAIARMPRLQRLIIQECGLSGSDCAGLEKLSALKFLTLGAPRLTEDSLRRINFNRSLEILDLSSPGMTDAGLAQLSLPHLKHLSLASKSVTGVGLSSLARSSQLVQLFLQCDMTDEGIAALRSFKKLRMLSVCQMGRSLSDRALDSLQELPELRFLTLTSCVEEFTKFTRAGILNLVDSLPDLSFLDLGQEDPRGALTQEILKRHPKLEVHFN